VELVASLKSLGEGTLFRTLNFDTPDKNYPLSVTRDNQQPTGDSFLKLSVTPQGQAAAVVVRKVF
jgi:3-oxoacyl-[acyl-carrier-protein] synthase II